MLPFCPALNFVHSTHALAPGPRLKAKGLAWDSFIPSLANRFILSFSFSFLCSFWFISLSTGSFMHSSVRPHIYWNLSGTGTWTHRWGSQFFIFPCESVCRTPRILAPIPPSEPQCSQVWEDPWHKGKVQHLWEGRLLGSTLAASISLWGWLCRMSETTAWGEPLLHAHLRLLSQELIPETGACWERTWSCLLSTSYQPRMAKMPAGC